MTNPSTPLRTRLAVFASGEGTNFQAILDGCLSGWIPAEVALLVASEPGAGAVHRAQVAGVPAVVLQRESFKTPKAYGEALAAACKEHGAEWVCLAGFLHKLDPAFLKAFPSRILNIHPALLPAFGGKGMYGRHVHEAVLAHGAKASGCTVHFVDEEFDHGPIVLQSPVAVLDGDTPQTLARRVQEAEHWAYPCAVRLAVQGRLSLEGRKVRVLPEKAPGHRVRRALLSVSDKDGLIAFAQGLKDLGVEIVSTSGTAKALKDAGIAVRPLASITAFPEILGGRVKTLHPKIHGGILFRRSDKAQAEEARAYGLEPIDLVAVNLYPFAETARKAKHPHEQEVIEQIDIGGPAMIRAAAKNYDDVAVVTSPRDYPALLEELKASGGKLSHETRMRLAGAAFHHTADYDTTIAQTLAPKGGSAPLTASNGHASDAPADLPQTFELRAEKAQDMRYGENPHQAAALYRVLGAPPAFTQLQGKPLSYNNLLDAESAWELVSEFTGPAAVIVKHNTCCGAGLGKDAAEAWEKAWGGDPVSAFGGILAVNRPVGAAIARDMAGRFMEVVIAPGFEPDALAIFAAKPNLRLIERKTPPSKRLSVRSLGTELLVQAPDRRLFLEEPKVVSRRKPSAAELRALEFAWAVAKHVRSNAIVLTGEDRTVGIGSGQMSRVDSVRWAGIKFSDWRKENPEPEVLALASDAFFPFRDGIDEAAKLGVTAVIEPGGSVRDAEVIKAADEHGMTLLFTGIRHFRH